MRTGDGITIVEGDHLVMDNRVWGKVDGFYKESVVFQPDWKIGHAVWGTYTHAEEGTAEPISDEVKHVAMSLLLVHPSNLRAEVHPLVVERDARKKGLL